MLRDVLASAPVPQKEIPALKETGFFIGRFIYLCDAWDDRESDKKHSLFNPFNVCGCTRDDAEFIINISINSAISAYNLLSTGRDRAILDNILFQGLFAVSDAVFLQRKKTAAAERRHYDGGAQSLIFSACILERTNP